MNTGTFFLAWQDKVKTRQWFPVGRLDVDAEAEDYRFRYTGGARRAQAEIGYCPVPAMPRILRPDRLARRRIRTPRSRGRRPSSSQGFHSVR